MNLHYLTNRERIFQINNAVLRSKQPTSLLKAESVKISHKIWKTF